MKFSEYDLHPILTKNLENKGFEECTPIQEQCFEVILKNKDVAGLAQTGTGKTGAFVIPLVERVLRSRAEAEETLNRSAEAATESAEVAKGVNSQVRAFNDFKSNQFILVLVPTRELAEQVHTNVLDFAKGADINSAVIYGGASYEKQKKSLGQGATFVVATPGRLIDLYKEHLIDLGQVRAVVFDEADRMFDMGFKDDMRYLLQRIPKDRQFLVFSATLNFDVLNVAYEFGADPVEVNVSEDETKAENVEDRLFHISKDEKPKFLLSLLQKHQPRQAIVFSNFKRNIDRIAYFLSENGFKAQGISSLMSQAQRQRVMDQFRGEGGTNILIATDVAARGLDIKGVDLVINYELPENAENYVHRIGRTGRAGDKGKAFSLACELDVDALARIEEYLGHKVEIDFLEDEELATEFKSMKSDAPYGGIQRVQKSRDRAKSSQGRGNPYKKSSSPRPKSSNRNDNRSSEEGEAATKKKRRRRRKRRSGPSQVEGAASSSGPRNSGGNGKSSHRDRVSGRHKGDNKSASKNSRSNNSSRRRKSGNKSGRPAAGSASAAKQAGIGQKVSGFFKRLFKGE